MKKNRFLITGLLLTLFILISTLFFAGCEKHDYEQFEELDQTMLNSTELEEYIIAGANLQQSLGSLTGVLNRIDFSTLEVTYEPGWKRVVHLPTPSIGSISIEEKFENLNEKKEALLKKFPQFASLREGLSKEYFRQSIEYSQKVSRELLEMGFKTSSPLLRSGGCEYNNTNWPNTFYLTNYLDSWINSPYYVEVMILRFEDGYYTTVIGPRNDANNSDINLTPRRDSTGTIIGWQYNGRNIVEFGHTHEAGGYGPNPSPHDGALPGVKNFIWYRGTLYYY